MTTAQLPDAELLALALLRAAYDSAVTVSPDLPADLASQVPYVTARRVGGAARHQRMLDVATIDVQSWASTRAQASALCRAAGLAFFTAYDKQTVVPDLGHLSAHAEVSGASELPSDVEGVWRFQATHSLTIRP